MRINRHDLIGTSRRGLTYGEMMVVLVVFIILGGMFLLSSQEVMIRTRISTVLSEEKTIGNALALYEFANLDVPSEKVGLTALEQPVQFLPYIPTDPFTKMTAEAKPYQYYQNISSQYRWLLVSVGPDGVSDIQRALAQRRIAKAYRAGGPSNKPPAPADALSAYSGLSNPGSPSGVGGAGDVPRRYGQPSPAGTPDASPLFASGDELNAFLAQYTYDPTNGANSGGDVIRLYGH